MGVREGLLFSVVYSESVLSWIDFQVLQGNAFLEVTPRSERKYQPMKR